MKLKNPAPRGSSFCLELRGEQRAEGKFKSCGRKSAPRFLAHNHTRDARTTKLPESTKTVPKALCAFAARLRWLTLKHGKCVLRTKVCSPIPGSGRRPAGSAAPRRNLKILSHWGRGQQRTHQLSGAPAPASLRTKMFSGSPLFDSNCRMHPYMGGAPDVCSELRAEEA